MTLLDANVFLYAYNADAPQQPAAARWLADLLSSGGTIGLPWTTLWAILRVSTNARIWPNPKSPEAVFALVREWLAQPGVVLVGPGPQHAEILERLVADHRVTGPLVSDAALAALAIENGASLASTDQEFRRFPGLRWIDPLAGETG
jgi:toxin-antitoxin system PIN domain toxin